MEKGRLGKTVKRVLILLIALFCFLAGAGILYLNGTIFSPSPGKADVSPVSVLTNPGEEFLKVQFIRHATLVLYIKGKKIVVDPMLSDPGALAPIPLTANRLRNPLIRLPVNKTELLHDVDAILLTHYHLDHFDKAAEQIIRPDTLIFCQPADEAKLRKKGFTNVRPVKEETEWEGLTLYRRAVNHARESSIKLLVGKFSSAYYIKAGQQSLFITGDTIYDQALISILNEFKPAFIAANTGAAQFLWGRPITLTGDSLKQIKQILPDTKIAAIHMNAINHCHFTKEKLAAYLKETEIGKDILIPSEGEIIDLTKLQF